MRLAPDYSSDVLILFNCQSETKMPYLIKRQTFRRVYLNIKISQAKIHLRI